MWPSVSVHASAGGKVVRQILDGITDEEYKEIADVFDALISERCYKNATTVEEAVQIIQNESGTHFDPNNHCKKIVSRKLCHRSYSCFFR